MKKLILVHLTLVTILLTALCATSEAAEFELGVNTGPVVLRNHEGGSNGYTLRLHNDYGFIGTSNSNELYIAEIPTGYGVIMFPVNAVRRAIHLGMSFDLGGMDIIRFTASPYISYSERVIEYHKGIYSDTGVGLQTSIDFGVFNMGVFVEGLPGKSRESSQRGLQLSLKF